MIDLNTIITQALTAAVYQATATLVERIEKLELTCAKQHERIAALENNPAIGVDTTLEQRVVALEQRMDHVIDASEKRIRVIAEAAAEQVMDLHLECYDHDDYDNVVSNWNDEDPTEFVRESDLDSKVTDAVSDALSNATVSISI